MNLQRSPSRGPLVRKSTRREGGLSVRARKGVSAMLAKTEIVPRRWERQKTDSPVRLVLDPAHFKADNSAVALDISLSGARVRTNLTLVPGDWVGVIPKGDFPHAIPGRGGWCGGW